MFKETVIFLALVIAACAHPQPLDRARRSPHGIGISGSLASAHSYGGGYGGYGGYPGGYGGYPGGYGGYPGGYGGYPGVYGGYPVGYGGGYGGAYSEANSGSFGIGFGR